MSEALKTSLKFQGHLWKVWFILLESAPCQMNCLLFSFTSEAKRFVTAISVWVLHMHRRINPCWHNNSSSAVGKLAHRERERGSGKGLRWKCWTGGILLSSAQEENSSMSPPTWMLDLQTGRNLPGWCPVCVYHTNSHMMGSTDTNPWRRQTEWHLLKRRSAIITVKFKWPHIDRYTHKQDMSPDII